MAFFQYHGRQVLPDQMITERLVDMDVESVCCICAYDQHGKEKTSSTGHHIVGWDHHLRNNDKHARYVAAGRMDLPHVAEHATIPNSCRRLLPRRQRLVYVCEVCSLDLNGQPRRKFCSMDVGGIHDHLTGDRHLERCMDGRYALRPEDADEQ